MKEIIHLYSGYDLWANTRMTQRLQRENDTVLDHLAKSSFSSLRLTALHIRDAGNAWCQRITGRSGAPYAEGARHIGSLQESSTALDMVVRSMDEKRLREQVTYINWSGATFTQPRWQLLMHAFNHAAYHRGQLVAIVHQLGLDEVPNTDMVSYQRLLMAGA
jgi:uncharacterized damage-inducible protein DinB